MQEIFVIRRPNIRGLYNLVIDNGENWKTRERRPIEGLQSSGL
jgi:hypothetical protein